MAELWNLPPNWSERYAITYGYKTDIFVSRSGKEQRRALRNTARRTVEYQGLAAGDKLRWFNRAMGGWQKHAFVMPERTRYVNAITPMPIGIKQMAVDGAPAWLAAGASVVLVYGDQMSLMTVETVLGTTVTFVGIDGKSWPPATKLHPAMSGRMADDLSTRRVTSEVATVGVVFNETPGSAPAPLVPAPRRSWFGTEVVLLKPNYAEAITLRHAWPVETIDFDRGLTATYVPIDFGTRTWQAQYVNVGQHESDQLINVFHRAKGRRGSFYMPTWENDLPPVDPLAQGSFRIRTAGTDVFHFLKESTVYRHVAVFTTDGEAILNEVEQMFTVADERGEDTVLTLRFAWEKSLPLDRILRICWMPRWRFASDSLTVSWLTDKVATITPTMQMLEDTQ